MEDIKSMISVIRRELMRENIDKAYIDDLLKKIEEKSGTQEVVVQAQAVDRPPETASDDISTSLKAIVNNLREIIFKTNRHGEYVYLNQAWYHHTGFTVEESLHKKYTQFFDSVHVDDQAFLHKIGEKNLEETSQLFRFTDRHGEERWFDAHVRWMRDEDGVRNGAIGSFMDVTERKKIELELIKANEAKNEFLSTISHEFRTPLNAIIGLTNLLLLNEYLPAQEHNLTSLKFSSEHLLGLIDAVLDFEQMDSGVVAFANEAFSLRKLLDGMHRTFHHLARAKGLYFFIEKTEAVPDRLMGDTTRLIQVISNLLNNAIKFTREGEIKLMIECLQSSEKSSFLRFTVSDTGIGISEEHVNKIFEPFTQADSGIAQQFGGTGLGLAICENLLELQGSHLRVESRQGVGSKFFFDWNFDHVPEASSNLNPISTVEKSLKGLSVLLVEDNELNIMVTRQFLDQWKVNTVTARDGHEALDKARHEQFDVVLMDLNLPKMDGYKTSRELRRQNLLKHDQPIIALTASARQDIDFKIHDAGMNGLLIKPFSPSALKSMLHDCMNKPNG